jgi:hypothetical protein
MQAWLVHYRARVAAKSPLGEALAHVAKYRDGLKLFLTDGRIEIDNNTVERTIRPIAINRKNALFAGHDVGAENWAIIASLVETCKLNAVDPQDYLTSTLTAIVNGHKQSRIEELLRGIIWPYRANSTGERGRPEALKSRPHPAVKPKVRTCYVAGSRAHEESNGISDFLKRPHPSHWDLGKHRQNLLFDFSPRCIRRKALCRSDFAEALVQFETADRSRRDSVGRDAIQRDVLCQ